MAQVTVYVPDKLWDRYKALRAELSEPQEEENGNVSKIVQAALTVAADELERAKGEKR